MVRSIILACLLASPLYSHHHHTPKPEQRSHKSEHVGSAIGSGAASFIVALIKAILSGVVKF